MSVQEHCTEPQDSRRTHIIWFVQVVSPESCSQNSVKLGHREGLISQNGKKIIIQEPYYLGWRLTAFL